MYCSTTPALISKRYSEVHCAVPTKYYEDFLARTTETDGGAAVGFRRAGEERLFLEHYLDEAIEILVSQAFGFSVHRHDIVELGNLASDSGIALLNLWSDAANDLGGRSQVAVATLIAPVRAMFARIGLPIVELAHAAPEALGDSASEWGRYYDSDPRVCAGLISEGQRALTNYASRRKLRKVA